MNKDFSDQVSTYNKDKFHIQAPGEQFWDGLSAEEKKNKTLVVVKTHKTDSGKEEYDKFIINKVNNKGLPISGVEFCIVDTKTSTSCNKYYNTWRTDKNGKIEIPVNELPLYTTYLYEKSPFGEVKGVDTYDTYKRKTIPLYVDPGNRFLGEVTGKNEQNEQEEKFITYKELLENIEGKPLEKLPKNPETNKPQTKVGVVLGLGEDEITGGNWLKIYDAREGKILYIAKKPLTNEVSWDMLYQAGVVFGPEFINTKNGDPNRGKIKTKEELGEEIYNNFKEYGEYQAKIIEINGKRYIVRLLRGENTFEPYRISRSKKGFKLIGISEWNRYILPLVKDYRYGGKYGNSIETALQEGGNAGYLGPSKNFKIQLATYNWFGDLTREASGYFWYDGVWGQGFTDNGQYSWTQEYTVSSSYRTVRGERKSRFGAASISNIPPRESRDDCGFRPVLEEIH